MRYDSFSRTSFLYKSKTFVFKGTIFIIFGSIQLDVLIPNIILGLQQNSALIVKIEIWWHKSQFFSKTDSTDYGYQCNVVLRSTMNQT